MRICSLLTPLLGVAVYASRNVVTASNSTELILFRGTQDHRDLAYRQPDIPTAASQDDRFETLVAALEIAELVDALGCSNWQVYWCYKYTVFAPVNEAFADDSVADVVAKYTTDGEYLAHLRALLLYHVADGSIMSDDIEDNGMVYTVNGESLDTTVNSGSVFSSGGVFINSARVVEADIDVKNGVIHGIDSLLLPSFVTNDIVAVADKAGIFTSLIDAAVATGVADDLAYEPLTVFAPTDDAFSKAANDIAKLSIEQIAEVLRYHVIADTIVNSNEVSTGAVETFQGENLRFRVRRRKRRRILINDNTRVTQADILASNGIIHVVNKVLFPPSILEFLQPTISDLLAESTGFTVLQTALESVNLLDTLGSEDGTFTVFAPTDRAFASLGDSTVNSLLGTSTLEDILLYHVLDSEVRSDELETGPITAVNGGIIGVSFYYGSPYLNRDTRIVTTRTDIMAKNGIIHVIDAVLLPNTIVDVLEERGFSRLVSTIDSVSGIREALSNTSSYLTLFAPTNRAIRMLGDISDVTESDLVNILTNHVVPGLNIFADLEEGDIEMLNGETVTVDFYKPAWSWYTRVYLLTPTVSARVRQTDIYAANGVIHVISQVLLP